MWYAETSDAFHFHLTFETDQRTYAFLEPFRMGSGQA